MFTTDPISVRLESTRKITLPIEKQHTQIQTSMDNIREWVLISTDNKYRIQMQNYSSSLGGLELSAEQEVELSDDSVE